MGARRLRLCRSRLLTTGTSSQPRALLTLRLVLLDDGGPHPRAHRDGPSTGRCGTGQSEAWRVGRCCAPSRRDG